VHERLVNPRVEHVADLAVPHQARLLHDPLDRLRDRLERAL
jgi:hypothetical protein